ncbi:MAG: type II toxin-antitoxin system HicA family toxin [Candidatus Rokubacteria bacterium]|nr:type II toxin-antitoxin system HicA family toxin [Candidatus Rokubacteria bacterium]
MSPRVPSLKPRKVIRTLQNAGFKLDRIEGSHYYFTNPHDP